MTTDQSIQHQDLPAVTNLDRPMTVQEVSNQSLVVHQILTQVMVKGVHYGVIDGTEKPTLLQPGAEKICATFRLAPKYDVDDLSEPHNNFFRYRVKCSLYTIRDSYFVGSAVGEASSAEEKYQWERAVCPEHFEATDPTRRRVKYRKDRNSAEGFVTVQQVQRNAADLANTVLKMATKRAMISATRGATAASDLLEVDLDEEAVQDLRKEEQQEKKEPLKARAKAKKAPAPKILFGPSQGKHMDDPSVPLKELKDYLQAKERGLGKPGRESWEAQDRLQIQCLKVEIAEREKAEPAKEKPAAIREPITDSEWERFLDVAQSKQTDAYEAAKQELGVQTTAIIAPEDRWKFYDLVQKYAGGK